MPSRCFDSGLIDSGSHNLMPPAHQYKLIDEQLFSARRPPFPSRRPPSSVQPQLDSSAHTHTTVLHQRTVLSSGFGSLFGALECVPAAQADPVAEREQLARQLTNALGEIRDSLYDRCTGLYPYTIPILIHY